MGAVHDTTDWVLAPEVAVTPVGGLGFVVVGTTALEAVEGELLPAPVVAVTVNV